MHLRLDDLRKQARMLQMYERSRTRSADETGSIQASNPGVLKADSSLANGMETGPSMADSVQPID